MDFDFTTLVTPFSLRQLEDVLADGFAGSLVRNTLAPRASAFLREQLGRLRRVRRGVAFQLGNLRAHAPRNRCPRRLLPADAVSLGEAAERPGEVGIVRWPLPMDSRNSFSISCLRLSSSTKTMISFSGPCTPMVSTRSMSAVRLGPVIKEMYLVCSGRILASTAGMSDTSDRCRSMAMWILGNVETSRRSTGEASCTSVPVFAMAQSNWLMPTLAPAAALARDVEAEPGSCCVELLLALICRRNGQSAHTAKPAAAHQRRSRAGSPSMKSMASVLVRSDELPRSPPLRAS